MGGMAKTKTHSRALAHYSAPRAARPIIVRETRTIQAHKKKGKGGHHRRGQSTEKVLMGLIVGGFAIGYLDKPGALGMNIPVIPVLGKAGTIAVAAHFFGKGKPGLATDIRNAAAVVASYEFGFKGSVSGGDEV